jgi:23S rRNA pseudouridine1911/1915/1917 synthase
MQEFKVIKASVGVRADVFVAEKFPKYTRAALKALFDRSEVAINKIPAKPGYKLRLGDNISVITELLNAQPGPIELPVIYEDDDVVVINKQAGVLTHSKGALNTEATVASFISSKITDKGLIGNRAGIVHRLDRHTSGVIICAKNAAAQSWMQKQFSQRKTKKTYLAVVEGVPEPDEAIIDVPIERSPSKPQTFRAGQGGKPAQTKYKVIKTTIKGGKSYSLLELKPVTGRTHQIRVHFKYIGHPVVGDRVYGHDGRAMLLHAKSLEITLPDKSRQTFMAPTPAEFKEFLGND